MGQPFDIVIRSCRRFRQKEAVTCYQEFFQIMNTCTLSHLVLSLLCAVWARTQLFTKLNLNQGRHKRNGDFKHLILLARTHAGNCAHWRESFAFKCFPTEPRIHIVWTRKPWFCLVTGAKVCFLGNATEGGSSEYFVVADLVLTVGLESKGGVSSSLKVARAFVEWGGLYSERKQVKEQAQQVLQQPPSMWTTSSNKAEFRMHN